MYNAADLKEAIEITENTVECPVKNCVNTVPRQRNVFKRLDKFKCPKHGIYISHSTFEYERSLDNILWKTELDQDLLFNKIFSVKRETERISRDNSEDAVTWNVFRYLEKEMLLQGFLSKLSQTAADNPEVIYWSYSQSEKKTWSKLAEVRKEFETTPAKGSEPDLIIKTRKALFLIEAKLNATNNTIPSSKDLAVQEKYEKGGGKWYENVFKSNFNTIAVVNRKYELLRFWLLGSRIADYLNLDFFLINLVPSEKEKHIETLFKRHIKESPNRAFKRLTWENSCGFISETKRPTLENERIIEYFKNKTIGYDRNGHLQKAFTIH